MALGGVNVRVGASTKPLQRDLRRGERLARRGGQNMGSALSGAFSSIILPLGFLASFNSAINSSIQAIRSVQFATGATGEALLDLQTLIRRIARQVPERQEVIAGVVGEVATRLELDAQTQEELVLRLLKLQRFAQVGGEQIAATLGQITSAFELDPSESLDILDKLLVLAQTSGKQFERLARLFRNYAGTLGETGLELNEVVGLIGALEKRGIAATTVISGFRDVLNRATQAGLDPQDTFREYISGVTSATTETEALTFAQDFLGITTFDTTRAIHSISNTLPEFIRYIQNAEGAAENLTDAFTFGENLSILRNSLEIQLAPTLDTLTSLVTGLQGVEIAGRGILDRISEITIYLFGFTLAVRTFIILINFFKNLGVTIITIIRTLGRFGIRILSIISSARILISALGGLGAVGTVVAAVIGAISLPVIIIVAAIALLVAGIVLLIIYWDEVYSFIKRNLIPILYGLSAAFTLLGSPIGNLIRWAILLGTNWDTIWTGIKRITQIVVDFIRVQFNRVIGFFRFLGSGLRDVLNNIGDFFDRIGDRVSSIGIIVATTINFLLNILNIGINRMIDLLNNFKIPVPEFLRDALGDEIGFNIRPIDFSPIEIPPLEEINSRTTLLNTGQSINDPSRNNLAIPTEVVQIVFNGDVYGLDEFQNQVVTAINQARRRGQELLIGS